MRRKTFNLICTSLVAILVHCFPLAAAEGNGGYAGAFFQVPIGARPTALGGAYLAVSDDGAGPLYNPAGLATLKRPLFATSYRVLTLDRRLGYVTLLFPVRGQAAIGFNWLYAGAGEITVRDQNGTDLGRELNFNHYAFALVFAKRFEDYLSAALKANYLHATFAEMTAFSVSFDLGLMLYISQFVDREKREAWPVKDIRVGLTVKHLAAKYRWNNGDYITQFRGTSSLSTDQDDAIPFEVGLGSSARFFERKLLVTADVLKNEKQDPFYHAGVEYLIVPELAIRAGYSDGRLTTGAGFLFHIEKHLLAIDYAFSTDKVDEGSEHIFSFDLLF